MEPFSNKGKCRLAVLIDIILSGLTLILLILFLIGMILQQSQEIGFLELLEEGNQPMEEVIILMLRMVVLLHFLLLVMVLFAGKNVLSKACYMSANTSDLDELNRGVRACKVFCRLEVMRMVLIVITFMGELSVFNLSIVLELVRNVFNLPVLFGWFFASEYQKELELRVEQVRNVHCLYTLSTSFPDNYCQNQNQCRTGDHCETNFYGHPARENQQHLGTFMNTNPAVAYFLSNSNSVR